MKAAVYRSYGAPEVVQLSEMPKPSPASKEIVVKVNATTVTAGDWRMRAGNPFIIRIYNGLFKIKRPVLGNEFSGVVDSIGSAVTNFKPGDSVFGTTGAGAGAHAEYVAVPADGLLAHKPDTIDDDKAAALPVGGLTALYFLQQASIQRGQSVLVNGASGSVGTYAVQLAKYFGAEVTAVCSAENEALVRSLGADEFIDYRKEQFTDQKNNYDIIFDAVGKASYWKSRGSLKPHGTYLTVAMSPKLIFQSLFSSLFGRYKLLSTVSKPAIEDFEYFINLVEKGIVHPVIDGVYKLSEIREAHRKAESGHKKGNLVIMPLN